MDIRTMKLQGEALAWAVAISLGYTDVQITGFEDPEQNEECFFRPTKFDAQGREVCGSGMTWEPQKDWSQGGPILEKHYQAICAQALKAALKGDESDETDLLAHFMRCFVASVKGDVIDIPQELVRA